MRLWAQIESSSLLSNLTTTDPEGRFHESIKFIEIPEDYTIYAEKGLLRIDDTGKFIIEQDIIRNKYLDRLSYERKSIIEVGSVTYKDVAFSTSKENLDNLSSKYNVGSITDAGSKKASYKTEWKTKGKYATLTTLDIGKLIQLISQFVDKAISQEKEAREAVTNAEFDNVDTVFNEEITKLRELSVSA